MTNPRAAAEILVLAHQIHGAPAPRRGPSPSAPPAARPASPPAPARLTAPLARPRLGLDEEGRPAWMDRMAIPLNGLPDSVLARLDQLGHAFEGWGRDADWNWFVDVAGVRYLGKTRHLAISAALAALGGTP